MTSANQNQINRLMREIADLQDRDAREAKREVGLVAKINRANEAAFRTKSVSMLQGKAREAERASNDLANVQKKRAEIAKKVSDKSKSMTSYQDRQAKEMERDRKRHDDQQKKLRREREQHERKITREIQSRAYVTPHSFVTAQRHLREENTTYDFFISHASEDKDSFVRGLAGALQTKGMRVWYDEFTLNVGDSLRRKIDEGLRDARYGVVVLSKNFFVKEWPQIELDGLVNLEVDGRTRILPIWHEVSKDEVTHYSPSLADKMALNTSVYSRDAIVEHLVKLAESSS